MKIRPTSRFIREKLSQCGEAILLLGVRSAESASRSGSIARHEAGSIGNLSPHSNHKGVWIFSPIKTLSTNDVWTTLLALRPPWGGSYRDVVTLYKNALGGECPFVVSNDDAPSCGSSSARFGCWTCTVVGKDSSIESLIAAGNDHLIPLADFRKRLKAVSEDPESRSKIRRNGLPGLGPLTFEARRMLLDELIQLQAETEMPLISDSEIRLVRDQWSQDKEDQAFRSLEKLEALHEYCSQPTTNR
jgi:DNA sulfur modification protein DndC